MTKFLKEEEAAKDRIEKLFDLHKKELNFLYKRRFPDMTKMTQLVSSKKREEIAEY